jgi:hypothetical protein
MRMAVDGLRAWRISSSCWRADERDREEHGGRRTAKSAAHYYCPAGRAPCAGGGHFVTCVGLRVGAPDGRKERLCRPSGGPGEAVYATKWCLPGMRALVRQDMV